MKFFVSLSVILLLAVTPFFCYSRCSGKSLYADYLKGVYFLQRDDLFQAQRYFDKAKKACPDSVYIRHKIASVLVQQEQLSRAEKVLEEAKQIDPDNLDTYLALIFIYSYRDQEEKLESEYEEFLRRAHQKKPGDMTISSYLAQFYFYQERLSEAIAIYEKILANNPENLEAFFWLGYLYYETDQTQRAIEKWKEGLAVDSYYAPILNALGYTYVEEGVNMDEAEQMIRKALEQEPHNGAYLDSLGWMYFKRGELEKAKKYVEKALTYAQDPEIYHHLGTIYIKLNKKEEGLNVYRKGLEKFPYYEDLKRELKKYEKENKNNQE